MRFAYKWGLIDANYILFRNKSMLAGSSSTGVISENELLTTTIQSFVKLKRAASFQYPILIWDKSPYYKIKAIQAYKADRWLPSDEAYAQLEAEKATCTDPIRLKEIEEEQKKIKIEQENFAIVKNIKKLFLSDEFKNFGFHSLIRSGYEADDLAFLTACKISELHKENEENSAILLTADKDWTNFQLPGVDFLSTYNWSSYTNLTEKFEEEKAKVNAASMKLYGLPCDITRYQWGVLEELMHSSHNNSVVWNHKRANRPEAMAKFFHRDRSLEDFDILDEAYKAMNMLIGSTVVFDKTFSESGVKPVTYVEDTNPIIEKALQDHYYEFGSFFEYCNKNFIILGFENYDLFVEGMDRK